MIIVDQFKAPYNESATLNKVHMLLTRSVDMAARRSLLIAGDINLSDYT